jgi:uncharacterized protein YbaR (Trm112 family)
VLLALVDVLRCPMSHDESSLVLSVVTWKDGQVQHGALGCPLCHARFPIVESETDFTPGRETVRHLDRDGTVDPVRLAAQLSLTEPGGILLLTGRYAAAAGALADLAGVTCVVAAPVPESARGVRVRVSDRLPLAPGALRGTAVDSIHVSFALLSSAVACTRPGGRIVAPAFADVPRGASLLARDDREWVAEVGDREWPVSLHRAGSRQRPLG